MTYFLIGGAVILIAVLGIFATSLKLVCREYTVESGKIKKSFVAVQISDLHESLFGEGQCELLDVLQDANPDLILITGDIIEDDESDPIEGQVLSLDNNARMLLEKLSGIAPSYMVFGNHESNIPNTHMLCEEIEALGVRVLHRRNPDDPDMREVISVNGEELLLCGADDPYFDRRELHKNNFIERMSEDYNPKTQIIVNWRERLRGEYSDITDEKRLTLLLSHRPEEYELYREIGFDAAFSGHAHGGQWRIPFILNGFYSPHQGFFPRHAGGCYRYGNFVHIVSRGLSKRRMVRIFNRPEICVVKFIPK